MSADPDPERTTFSVRDVARNIGCKVEEIRRWRASRGEREAFSGERPLSREEIREFLEFRSLSGIMDIMATAIAKELLAELAAEEGAEK